MHQPSCQRQTRLPVRERLRLARLASRKKLALCSALLCAGPLLYLLKEVLRAQP